MIRYVLMAALFGGLGVGGASVDWQSDWNAVTEWYNTPNEYTYFSDFYYWRQCDACYDIFSGNETRTCCKSCGGVSFTTIKARLLGTNGWDPDHAEGYQTSDGVLYIMKGDEGHFSQKFFIGPDRYTRATAIIARNASLRAILK
ncbi:hypothetical protein LCGC14_2590190 [marine sediment metagenome]|uniref:Uncharacterized protein n=1 Tax=marine sediment metagenome TaxID=412755 RepID=A0A0F9AZR5_9ZZZZ